MKDALLSMKNISKNYPGVCALDSVDFDLFSGSIHALLGENGAGKSTLIKVLTGADSFQEGAVKLQGEPILAKNPQHAQVLGISTVYQEVNLCPNLSVAENIYIGREPLSHRLVDWKTIHKGAQRLLQSLDIDIDVTLTLDNYSIAIQQMVAIARALDMDAKVLILDEPTSSLDAHETARLFEIMRSLRNKGTGIIFVTHFLDQVYEVCDSITVLRNGEKVGDYTTAGLSRVDLVAKMIGKDYDSLNSFSDGIISLDDEAEILLETDNLTTDSIAGVSLHVKEGEVLGFAGLLGSGRTEQARALFGADRRIAGQIRKKKRTLKFTHPLKAIREGVAYCSEDRKKDGIFSELSIRENIIIALQAKKGLFHFLKRGEQNRIAEKYIDSLQVATPGREQLIGNLSGGNQQKVLIGRWMATSPGILMLDEPTRGIDVGTKAEIQKLVLKLAGDGMGLVYISSELDEMLRCCSRMLVMHDKKVCRELKEHEINEKTIMDIMAGDET